jgi:hypothetical protein
VAGSAHLPRRLAGVPTQDTKWEASENPADGRNTAHIADGDPKPRLHLMLRGLKAEEDAEARRSAPEVPRRQGRRQKAHRHRCAGFQNERLSSWASAGGSRPRLSDCEDRRRVLVRVRPLYCCSRTVRTRVGLSPLPTIMREHFEPDCHSCASGVDGALGITYTQPALRWRPEP